MWDVYRDGALAITGLRKDNTTRYTLCVYNARVWRTLREADDE